MTRALSHTRIKAINEDLIQYVDKAATTRIGGKDIGWIYESRNGVFNHGFDEDKHYNIFVKEGNYALVTEVKNLAA